MTRDTSFHEYVLYDLLANEVGISSKPMFGGWGMYKHGVIFGIISDENLYFKVGDENRKDFENIGSHPFVFAKKGGKKVSLSYWIVPEEIMEDREKFLELIEKSVKINR